MNKGILIVCGILLLLFLLKLGAEWWLEGRIRRELESNVLNGTHGACQTQIAKVKVNLFSRSVRLMGVKVRTDSACMVEVNPAIKIMHADIGHIWLRGVGFRLKKEPRHITARSLEIMSPHILIASDTTRRLAVTLRQPQAPLPERISQQFGRLAVGQIEIHGGSMEYRHLLPEDTVVWLARGFDLRAVGLQIDSTRQTRQRALYCDDIHLALESFSGTQHGGATITTVDSLRADTRRGTFSVAGLSIVPQYPKEKYAQRVYDHSDWTTLRTGAVRGEGLDLSQVMTGGPLLIDTVSLAGLKVESYKNRQIAADDKYKPLFWESIQRLGFPLAVRRLDIGPSEAVYEELSLRGERPGKVFFTDLQGVLHDLTNVPGGDTRYMTLVAKARLMGKGQMAATFLLPVDSLDPHFEVKGSLGAMDMTDLNGMLEPLAKIQIDRGEIDGLGFHLTGESMQATVRMELRYHGLDVAILKEKDDRVTERRFISNLVNRLILESANPDRRGVRIANGHAARDPYRSQFNFLWRTLLSGIMETVGLQG